MSGQLIDEVRPLQHLVHFFASDAELHASVSEHLADGVAAGETVLVVATSARRRAFSAELNHLHVDVDEPRTADAFVWIDAREALDQFMVDGVPEADRFARSIGQRIAEAARRGRPVRAFGEMVALLWASGNVSGAIVLEALWNDLLSSHDFSLYCAYPMAEVRATDNLAATQQICAHHSGVVSPASEVTALAPESATHRSALFVRSVTSIQDARGFVAGALTDWGCPESVTNAQLIVSELATNAVRHADSAFRVVLDRLPSSTRISVHDTSVVLPAVRPRGGSQAGGHGLAIIDRLSESAGADLTADGKVVWCQLSETTSH